MSERNRATSTVGAIDVNFKLRNPAQRFRSILVNFYTIKNIK
jgi:hypothetical protein